MLKYPDEVLKVLKPEDIDLLTVLNKKLDETQGMMNKLSVMDEILEVEKRLGLIMTPDGNYVCEGCSA